jgi:hypothetical protein
MSTIHYAIEIITDVATTDTDYGLVAGTFRFVTDRPGYDGSPTYPTWEDTTDNTAVWFEGWIMKDGLSRPSRRVDITGTGDYGTNSGFNFNIRNDVMFWDFIETNSIWLTNRTVKFYTIVDDVFYQTWTGVISNQPYSETDYTFECVDSFKTVHKEMPPSSVNATEDPDADQTGLGETIPITIGNVQYAKLTRVSNLKKVYDVVVTGGTHYKVCGGVNYGIGDGSYAYENNLDLLTTGISFSEDELVGKYINAVSGDKANKEKLVRIRANKATITYPSIALWTGGNSKVYTNVTLTRIGLDDPLEYATIDEFKNTYRYEPGVATNDVNTWFFSIVEMAVELTPSSSAIAGYQKDANNRILLYTYDKNTNAFSPADDRINAVVDASGNLDISLRATSISSDGQVEVISQIPFTCTSQAGGAASPVTMYDKDNTTSYRTFRQAFASWNYGYAINIYPDVNYDFSKVSEIYIAPNIKFTSTVAPYGIDLAMSFKAYDVYGNLIADMPKEESDSYYENWGLPSIGAGVSNELDMIPKDYFNEHAPVGLYNYWGGTIIAADAKRLDLCKLDGEVLDLIKAGRIKRIEAYIKVKAHSTAGSQFYLDITELGVFGIKTIATLDEDIYASINGETSGSIDPGSVYGTFNHILVDYDGISPTDIDYSNLGGTRLDWPVARQITDKKNSYDYLRELAEQSFTAIFPTRTGKRKLMAWRENNTVAATHTQNEIIRDSIKTFTKTQIKDLFNAFSFTYSYNYATKKYDRVLLITNVEQAAFPASTDNSWRTFVGGVNPDSYADAKAIWDLCHLTYVKSKAIQKAPDSISKLSWYADQDPLNSSGASVDNSPWKFLVNCSEWTTRQKDVVTYSIPISAANITLEMLDFIHFSDAIFTNSIAREGWISSITVDPKNDILILEATLQPIELDTFAGGLIIERGPLLNTDTITENGAQTDTITEGA